MARRTALPHHKICAMCTHWNGPRGGDTVQAKPNMRNIMEYDDSEKKVCYDSHREVRGWQSCSKWQQRY